MERKLNYRINAAANLKAPLQQRSLDRTMNFKHLFQFKKWFSELLYMVVVSGMQQRYKPLIDKYFYQGQADSYIEPASVSAMTYSSSNGTAQIRFYGAEIVEMLIAP